MSSSQREARIPGPDHPITIEPTAGRVVVRVGDQVIADSTRALTLQEASYPPAYYVPLDDIDPAVLVPSTTDTYCPYKGDASYYSVATPGDDIADAIWTYATPYDAVAAIAGHGAFYTNKVDVSVED